MVIFVKTQNMIEEKVFYAFQTLVRTEPNTFLPVEMQFFHALGCALCAVQWIDVIANSCALLTEEFCYFSLVDVFFLVRSVEALSFDQSGEKFGVDVPLGRVSLSSIRGKCLLSRWKHKLFRTKSTSKAFFLRRY